MALIDSIVVTHIRADACNVFISALELFNFYFILFCYLCTLLSTPKGSCAFIWLGSTFPFLKLGFWVSYQAAYRFEVRVVFQFCTFEQCTWWRRHLILGLSSSCTPIHYVQDWTHLQNLVLDEIRQTQRFLGPEAKVFVILTFSCC